MQQVFAIDEKVMVGIKLPELAVDYIKVLVAKEVSDLVDVILILE